MFIETSTDWSNIETELRSKARNLTFHRDIDKLIFNVRMKVTELSKAEVLARRGQKHRAEELLKEVNKEIEMIEECLLVAKLIG